MVLQVDQVITERDIVRKAVASFGDKDQRQILASEIMSKPLISVGEDASIYDAALIIKNIQSDDCP